MCLCGKKNLLSHHFVTLSKNYDIYFENASQNKAEQEKGSSNTLIVNNFCGFFNS